MLEYTFHPPHSHRSSASGERESCGDGKTNSLRFTKSLFITVWFHVLFTGALVAQDPAYREVATGGYAGTNGVFASALGRRIAKLSNGDVDLIAGKALVRVVSGNSRCELPRCVGRGGAIAMSDAGTDGAFLAVYWDDGGVIRAAWRTAGDAPFQQLPLGKMDGDEVRIHYRSGVLYSYVAVPGGLVEPLVAVPVDLGNEPLMGVLSLGDFSCDEPRIEGFPVTLAHTFDLDLAQAGTGLSPSWEAKEADTSINGRYLFHPPGDEDASAKITVHDLNEGSYDLWMSDHPSEEATGKLDVHVGGATVESAFAISQRNSGRIWLGLGRHQVHQGASLSIAFRRGEGNSSSVSLDALHLVRSEWKDENQETLPQGQESVKGSSVHVALGEESPTSNHAYTVQELTDKLTPSGEIVAAPPGKGLTSGNKIVFYIDAKKGNDSYDGRDAFVRPGPWHSSRRGPLRTIQKAVDSIGNAAIVELYLSGDVEQPAKGINCPHDPSFHFKSSDSNSVYVPSYEGGDFPSPPRGPSR